MTIDRRALGKTGLEVSVLGLGAGPLGDARLGDDHTDSLVRAALDRGVTLFDTAPSYGTSEERLGRALGERRKGVVLVTKGGYGVPGVADWTGEVIRLGIEAALGRLRTDVIDVFLLHSCDASTLMRDDILGELDRAKAAGKIRAAGPRYVLIAARGSSDNAARYGQYLFGEAASFRRLSSACTSCERPSPARNRRTDC